MSRIEELKSEFAGVFGDEFKLEQFNGNSYRFVDSHDIIWMDGSDSDLFAFTDKDKYKEFIARSTDYKLAHNQLVAIRNIIYFIREFAYSRNYDKIKSQIENKLKWYDKQILERNQEAFKL